MALDHLLLILLVGLVAGFLATHLVAGHGYGVAGDIVVGVIGSLLGYLILGTWLAVHVLTPLGIDAASDVGRTLTAFIGAALLLAILRVASSSGWGGRGRWL